MAVVPAPDPVRGLLLLLLLLLHSTCAAGICASSVMVGHAITPR
jgi:hypothetical protein